MRALTKHTSGAFALLVLAAAAGFWKSYFMQLEATPLLTHVHAMLMALWCALLVVQPLLVHLGARIWHRRLGASAWVLVPAIVVVSMLLAIQMTRPAPGAALEPFRYGLFFVQCANVFIFGLCTAAALLTRREPALHARWMVASGLTLVDPVFARVFTHLGPPWPVLVEFGSTALALAIMLFLALLDRDAKRGRYVFAVLAAIFAPLAVIGSLIGDWEPWRRWMQTAFA